MFGHTRWKRSSLVTIPGRCFEKHAKDLGGFPPKRDRSIAAVQPTGVAVEREIPESYLHASLQQIGTLWEFVRTSALRLADSGM